MWADSSHRCVHARSTISIGQATIMSKVIGERRLIFDWRLTIMPWFLSLLLCSFIGEEHFASDTECFNLSQEDTVIATWIFRYHACIDECQYIGQHRGTCRNRVVGCMTKVLETLFALGGKAAWEILLLFSKHINCECSTLAYLC